MLVLEAEDSAFYDAVEQQNLLRQYDLLTNCIEIGITQGPRAFDKYMLWALNHAGVANVSQLAGRFREEPVYLEHHTPPHFKEVPGLMDQFIITVHENWYTWSETVLAAYALWRLNWIHPFVEGNGRTARAACYYLLCVRSGALLRGEPSIAERIRHDRDPYYAALREADRAWDMGRLEFPKMEAYIARLAQEQMMEMPLS